LKIPGASVMGIYGHYHIEGMHKIADVLGEKVLLLINEIAEIIHSTADYFTGTSLSNS